MFVERQKAKQASSKGFDPHDIVFALSFAGILNWMAPEVVNESYDEKCDSWAIGCLLLELMTCHLFDEPEVRGKLFEIKHNPDVLLELADRISEVAQQLQFFEPFYQNNINELIPIFPCKNT